jgi:hypothetical protein
LPLSAVFGRNPLIDWFHITMRLTVMGQMAKGLEGDVAIEAAKDLERLKWFLWHGNVFRALQVVEDLEVNLDVEGAGPGRRKLVKALAEFGRYIGANAEWIPNYGERHRCGEAISNAFVESAVNQVVSKRMVKRQQMRWSPRGAHLLLQIRTRVLNDDLAGDFRRWYPALMPTSERQAWRRELPHFVPLSFNRNELVHSDRGNAIEPPLAPRRVPPGTRLPRIT